MLRDYRSSDEAAFVAYHDDPSFAAHYPVDETGPEHARRVFGSFLEWQEASPRLNFQFAVCRQGDDRTIGSCGVRRHAAASTEADFGIELARSHWGQHGVAIEIAMATMDWAFDHLPVCALTAQTAATNEVVTRMAERAGFERCPIEPHVRDQGVVRWRLERPDAGALPTW